MLFARLCGRYGTAYEEVDMAGRGGREDGGKEDGEDEEEEEEEPEAVRDLRRLGLRPRWATQ